MVGKNCNFTLTVFPETVIVTGSKRRSKMAKASITSGELPKAIFDVTCQGINIFAQEGFQLLASIVAELQIIGDVREGVNVCL